jgi:Cu/Ag efflux pump CusA
MDQLERLYSKMGDKGRMSVWLVVTIVLCVIVAFIARHQLGVTVYKLSLISLGAYIGYWIDRGLSPYARPHDLINKAAEAWQDVGRWEILADLAARAMLRRAIIVAACVVAAGLGA